MKLETVRLCNFQSFGPQPQELNLNELSILIGPNGSGKTAALQALCRMFAFDPSLRRILRSDFHVPFDETEVPVERKLWIEADFIFPELMGDKDSSTVAPHFNHMRLDEADGIPRVRFRLSASMGPDGDIEDNLTYVLDVDAEGTPISMPQVARTERNHIHVHYLPARRDPANHITYSANALLGRMLRAINWDIERENIKGLTDQISASLASNLSINRVSENLKETWKTLHTGGFFSDPNITFVTSEIESLLRHMSVSFSPGHDDNLVDFTRLSDGQKSILYLSLVLTAQSISRSILTGTEKSFDIDKLRPPTFTLVAVEEPENSLSPHYLGRIINALNLMIREGDAQALIATHAPSILRRIEPEDIRHLRLSDKRTSKVTRICLPDTKDESYKFVRQAVQAFPEIYFSRLVILGEGDSEEIVLPRLLQAKGHPVDETAITIAPLGGRHVNHFWRLLSALDIPFITLLDLDISRYGAGWGRIKYVNDQLQKISPDDAFAWDLPKWNDEEKPIREYQFFEDKDLKIIRLLEEKGIFFSYPLDLDFSMLLAYPGAYNVTRETPNDSTIKAVLGNSHHDSSQYNESEKSLFGSYHRLFKLSSKPATHIEALANLRDDEILANMPKSFNRLINAISIKLKEIHE